MDIVIPYRQTEDDGAELRFALRSLCANLSHDKLWLVGDRPSWVTGVGYLPRKQDSHHKTLNVRRNMLLACATPDVSETFIYSNDDFYVLDHEPDLNVYRLTIDHLMAYFESQGPLMGHGRTVLRTGNYLRTLGIEEPLAFDSLHWPQVFEKKHLVVCLKRCANAKVKCWATLYGNLYRDAASLTQVENAKHHQPQD